MTDVDKSAGDGPLVSRIMAGDALRRALRLYVGTGRRYTVKEMQRGTGLSARLVEGWLAGPESTDWRECKASCLLSLCAFLGPEFATDIMRLASLGCFSLVDDDEPDGVRALGLDAVDDAAAINRATSDGELTRTEASDLRVVALRRIAHAGQILARAS